MHPLIKFAEKIDEKIISSLTTMYMKSTSKPLPIIMSNIPMIYYVLAYFGTHGQTMGESLAMIKINSKSKLLMALIFKFGVVNQYPSYKEHVQVVYDLIFYLFAIPGWIGLFNTKYIKTRSDLPFDSSKVFLYSGYVSIVYYGIIYLRKLKTITDKPNRVELQCHLCLENINNITSFPCGHVCCWKCAVNWIQTNPSCFLCRQPSTLQDLILLKDN